MSALVGAATLLGGIGLFLLGMTMLTEGLKLAAGRALERILTAWTRTRVHGLVTGVLLTALVQSSTAMTVAAIGFVNAGLLSFPSALWVVFGSNVGSSVTGWLVAAIGFNVKIDAFALPFIGLGMALKITGAGTRRGALGTSLAGLGVLFLGIDLLKTGFEGLGPQALPDLGSDARSMAVAVLVGLLLTIVMQASSATLTLVLTAVGGGMLPLDAGAAMVVGANVGTTLTGILAAIGATSNAKRLAAAHVLFNVVAAVVAMAVLRPMLDGLERVSAWFGGEANVITLLVLFHTTFNVLGVLLMWPLSKPLVRFLLARFHSADEDAARARFLDRNVVAVPELAVQALLREMVHLAHSTLHLAAHAVRLQPLGAAAPSPHGAPASAAPQAPASLEQAGQQLTRSLQTVEKLQAQIIAFVSELGRQPMPQDVAQRLPQLLRIATHFDTLARVMHQVGQRSVQGLTVPGRSFVPAGGIGAAGLASPPEGAATAMASAGGSPKNLALEDCLAPVFGAALAFFTSEKPDGPWMTATERDAFEQRYQVAKGTLLELGARGSVPVAVDWLAQLSDLRRAVAQGYKAAAALSALAHPQHGAEHPSGVDTTAQPVQTD